MTLTADDMVRAGEAALRLLDIDGRVAVLPVPPDPDPEGVPDAVVEVAGDDWREEVHLFRWMSATEAVVRTADKICEYISESSEFWGVEFPRCPGHRHAAGFDGDDTSVTLVCPSSGAEIMRVTP